MLMCFILKKVMHCVVTDTCVILLVIADVGMSPLVSIENGGIVRKSTRVWAYKNSYDPHKMFNKVVILLEHFVPFAIEYCCVGYHVCPFSASDDLSDQSLAFDVSRVFNVADM